VSSNEIVVNLQLTGPMDNYVAEALAAEADGFAMVCVPDHPGTGVSTSAVLGALATATSTIRVGAYVLNAGRHEPLDLANDTATIDRLSGGRVVLGLGAGHTPLEWTMYGERYPKPSERVDRLIELTELTTRLLDGDTVTHHGVHLRTNDAHLREPRPLAEHVPLLIGGSGRRVLELGGRSADIVGYSGLGPTKADGHTHESRWKPTDTDLAIRTIERAAHNAGRSMPEVDVLVQVLTVVNDRARVLQKFAGLAGAPIDELDHIPFVFAGPLERIVNDVRTCAERWGIASFTVRDRAAGAALIAALAS
jgi:probable F420-dependent oxidoreductase